MINTSQLVQDVLDGNEDPLKAYGILKQHLTHVQNGIEQIMPDVLSDADNYTENSFKHKGFKFEKRQGRRVFDFKGIPEWVKLNDLKKANEAMYKGAADAYGKGKTMIDDGGEVVPCCVVTYASPSIVVAEI